MYPLDADCSDSCRSDGRQVGVQGLREQDDKEHYRNGRFLEPVKRR